MTQKTNNPQNIQDVVAEKAETIIDKMHDAGIDAFPVSAWQADDGKKIIIETLTQLVKEVEAGEEKNIISILENAGYVNVKETLYYHKKPMFVVDGKTTPPTSDVIEK